MFLKPVEHKGHFTAFIVISRSFFPPVDVLCAVCLLIF